MIKGYTRPQLLIRQVLEVLPDQEERTLHAFAVGPQFDLHRYTNAEERAAMVGVPFAENADTDPAARQVIPYEGITATQIVDEAFARVYGENLEGQLWAAASGGLYDFEIQSLLFPNKLRVIRRQAVITATNGSNGGLDSIVSVALVEGGSGYAAGTTIDQPVVGGTGTGAVIRMTTNLSGVVTAVEVVAPGAGYVAPVTFSATAANSGANVGYTPDALNPTPLIPELRGRPLKTGDILYTTLNGITVRRTIREIEKELVAAHYGTDAGKSNKQFLASALNPIKTDSAEFANAAAPANWGIELAKGTILAIDVLTPGNSYTSAPSVVISDPIEINAGGLTWPAEEAIASAAINTSGQVTGVTIDVAGAGYYVGGLVGYTIVTGGTGYDSANPPKITVTTPSGGEAATLEAVISGGEIVGVKILDPGYGYTTHVGNVTYTGLALTGGAGTGAQIIMVANLGSIRAATITNPGAGYVDAVTLAGPTGGSAFAALGYLGLVSAPPVAAGGTGYAVGDISEVDLGTAYLNRKARVRVTAETAGVVTAVEVVEDYEGWYSAAFPVTATEATTAITGAGNDDLTLDMSGGLGLTLVRITNPGAGYTATAFTVTPTTPPTTVATGTFDLVVPPTVTLSGGGGTGATISFSTRSLASEWNGLIEGSTYDNKYGERYTITVTKSGSGIEDAQVRIRSASGAFSANSVPARHYGLDYIVDHPALGGLSVSLRPLSAATALKLGDTFSFTVTGAYLPLELAATGRLLAINTIAVGSGYTGTGTHPLVIAAPPTGGTQATGFVTIAAGAVSAVRIENPGNGYLSAPLITLPVAAGPGTGAVLEGVLTAAEDSRDLTVVQSGVYAGPKDTRYQIKVIRGSTLGQVEESFTNAIVRVSDSAGIDEIQEYTVQQGVQYDLGSYGLRFLLPENQATPSGTAGASTATADGFQSGGLVTNIEVTDQGEGYTVVPDVVITDGGPGVGATATAVLHQGKVIEIIVTNAGSGYTSPVVTIAAPVSYQGGLRTGDTYYIDAVAQANSGPYSNVVLNGQVTDITGWTELDIALNQFDVDFRVLYSGIIEPRRNSAPDLAWEAGATADGGILLEAALALEVPERDSGFEWVPVKNSANGRLFAHWRALVPATSGDKIKLYYSESEIIAAFGKKDMDNPACYGAVMAFLGGQEKPVYASRLATNDLAGHQTLIRQAEHVEGIYAIAPATYDQTIKDAWKAHVAKMSLENWKLWRRVYLGTQNVGPYSVLATKEDGTNFEATVTTNSAGNVRVVSMDGNFITKGIRPGDLFRTNFFFDAWGDLQYEQYEVGTVSTEDELILKTGPVSPIAPAIKFEIWRPDNGLSQVEYVGNKSDALANRRAINVWCDTPNIVDADSNLFTVPVYYLAAEVAGLRAAVLPQQGLTYTELNHSLDGAPLMFTKYTEEELNVAAANGTWIVTQDQEDGPIYIRHQLTTDTENGILYYEDSIGTNLDNIAYAVKDIFQPYIGKRNTNVETLEEMETKIRDLLDTFKKNPAGFSNIGPALINWTNLKIAIDVVFKDRINIEVTLELPLPINTIIVTLRATTASDETVASINATIAAT